MPDGSMLFAPPAYRGALVRAETADEQRRTVELIFTTGATVRRRRGFFGDEIDEELIVSPSSVRLARLKAGAPFLNSHNSFDLGDVLGVVEDARIEDGEGRATVRFSERESVEPIFRDIAGGIIRNVSVGYRVHAYEIEKRDGQPELWRAIDWEPLELSAVAIGADEGAQFRTAETGEKYPFTRTYKSTGKVFKMSDTRIDPHTEDAAKKERERVLGIQDTAKRFQIPGDLVDKLIGSRLTLQESRNEMLDFVARRDDAHGSPVPFDAIPGRDIGHKQSVLEIFFEERLQGRNAKPDLRREIGGSTLVDLARYAVRGQIAGADMMNDSRIIGAALQTRSAGVGYAALGSGDFTVALENVMNKELLRRLSGEPSGMMRVAFKSNATDFRPQNRYRGGAFPDLLPYTEGTAIKRGNLPDAAREKIQLKSNASIVALTRQAMVNDDLSILTDFLTGAAEGIRSTIMYQLTVAAEAPGLLSDGVAAIATARGNKAASGGALSETTLTAAKLAMRTTKDLNGRPAGITPRYLLVPPALEVPAQKLLATVNAQSTANINPHTDLELVVEARLASATGWFLFADPAEVRALEYAFLDGQENGMIETFTGPTYDAIEIRSILDLGVAFIDPRGVYYNAGA